MPQAPGGWRLSRSRTRSRSPPETTRQRRQELRLGVAVGDPTSNQYAPVVRADHVPHRSVDERRSSDLHRVWSTSAGSCHLRRLAMQPCNRRRGRRSTRPTPEHGGTPNPLVSDLYPSAHAYVGMWLAELGNTGVLHPSCRPGQTACLISPTITGISRGDPNNPGCGLRRSPPRCTRRPTRRLGRTSRGRHSEVAARGVPASRSSSSIDRLAQRVGWGERRPFSQGQ